MQKRWLLCFVIQHHPKCMVQECMVITMIRTIIYIFGLEADLYIKGRKNVIKIKLSKLVGSVPYETEHKLVQELLFNKKTFELEQKKAVLEALNISCDDFIPWDYDYIPLFDVSLAQTQRDYLISSCRRDCKKILDMCLTDIELEFYFRKELEFNEIRTFWWQHYDKLVKQKSIEWCNTYNIPFEDDMPEVKPVKMKQSVVSDC